MAAVHFATVTRIDAVTGKPYVIARLRAGDHEFGPCNVAEGPWTPGQATELTANPGGSPDAFASHLHGLGDDLAAGDRVLVVFAEDVAGEVAVVLCRIAL